LWVQAHESTILALKGGAGEPDPFDIDRNRFSKVAATGLADFRRQVACTHRSFRRSDVSFASMGKRLVIRRFLIRRLSLREDHCNPYEAPPIAKAETNMPHASRCSEAATNDLCAFFPASEATAIIVT